MEDITEKNLFGLLNMSLARLVRGKTFYVPHLDSFAKPYYVQPESGRTNPVTSPKQTDEQEWYCPICKIVVDHEDTYPKGNASIAENCGHHLELRPVKKTVEQADKDKWYISGMPPLKFTNACWYTHIYDESNLTVSVVYGPTPQEAEARAAEIVMAHNELDDFVDLVESSLLNEGDPRPIYDAIAKLRNAK
jgi:hypothetical protein